MHPNSAKELLQRYLDGSCDRNERKLVENWYAQLDETGEWQWEPGEKELFEQYLEKRLLESISAPEQRPAPAPKAVASPAREAARKGLFLRRWWAAASIVLVLGAGAWIWIVTRNQVTPGSTVVQNIPDIAPGKEGAILTLADGTQVVLDSMGNGMIAQQNGVQVLLQDGELSYRSGNILADKPSYNMMRTPKGRQFQVTLPDGTKAWLNAASSISYPTVFKGKERSVKITGEIYFEVARNEKMPFRVNVNDRAEVEVLGTHFNINAYENEAHIAMTLLEGSVRVDARERGSVMLKPGQQAMLGRTEAEIRVVKDADTDKVMAWKNGFFHFDGAGLKEVMQQLERWYDIEVIYEKGVPDTRFAGKIKRNVTLAGILKALEESEIRYRMEGRKLIVQP